MSYDVIIVGGGTSGVVSAFTLAKKGKKVLILEKLNQLTGTQGVARVTPYMASNVNGNKYSNLFIEETIGTAKEVFSPEKYMFNTEKILKDLGVDIYYGIEKIVPIIGDSKIEAIKFDFNNVEYTRYAKNFIDASGDAILSRRSGIEVISGNEHGDNQSVSLRFDIANIDIEKLKVFLATRDYKFCSLDNEFLEFVHVANYAPCGGLLEDFKDAVSKGALKQEDANYIQGFTIKGQPKCMTFNNPQLPKIADFKTIEGYSEYLSYGRLMQVRLHNFLKNNIPGFEESYISNSAGMLGIRESYRCVGEKYLKSDAYVKREKFDDAVCKCDWYVDVHVDVDTEENYGESVEFRPYEKGEYYELPFRCTYNNKIRNLNFIGRIVSVDFYVQSSIRVQHHCQDMASSVAEVISYAIDNEIDIVDITPNNVKEILSYE